MVVAEASTRVRVLKPRETEAMLAAIQSLLQKHRPELGY